MPASPDAPAARHAAVLRAVWQQAPTLTLLAPATSSTLQRPVLVTTPQPALHLPRQDTAWHAAAVAHMAAHLAHGGPPVERGQLKPIQRALFSALEDARVEHQALRALPGLLTLWLPWHTASPQDGHSFDTLLQRLQRRLLDPHYDDPHPWIHKAWQLVQQAEPGPAGLRRVASLLGHDVGQMRLPFNARTDTVGPAYRDDNHHLWWPDPQAVASQTVLTPSAHAAQDTPQDGPGEGAQAPHPTAATEQAATPTAQHPEWDRLIARHRPRWCSVVETEAPRGNAQALSALLATQAPLQRRLQRALQPTALGGMRRHRADDGPAFHLPSLVQAAVQQRLQRTPDPRVYDAAKPASATRHVLVLLDSSASTADAAPAAWGPGLTLLQALGAAAWLSTCALAQAGHSSALMAFRSHGRHQVDLLRLTAFHAHHDGLERLAGLRSEGSTRLGAAVRHACWRLQGLARPQVLLLTDGEPHDVDVFDRRYLLDDLRQAVLTARRSGIPVGCLVAGAAPSPALQRAFSPGACRPLRGWQALPQQLLQALG